MEQTQQELRSPEQPRKVNGTILTVLLSNIKDMGPAAKIVEQQTSGFFPQNAKANKGRTEGFENGVMHVYFGLDSENASDMALETARQFFVVMDVINDGLKKVGQSTSQTKMGIDSGEITVADDGKISSGHKQVSEFIAKNAKPGEILITKRAQDKLNKPIRTAQAFRMGDNGEEVPVYKVI